MKRQATSSPRNRNLVVIGEHGIPYFPKKRKLTKTGKSTGQQGGKVGGDWDSQYFAVEQRGGTLDILR